MNGEGPKDIYMTNEQFSILTANIMDDAPIYRDYFPLEGYVGRLYGLNVYITPSNLGKDSEIMVVRWSKEEVVMANLNKLVKENANISYVLDASTNNYIIQLKGCKDGEYFEVSKENLDSMDNKKLEEIIFNTSYLFKELQGAVSGE